MAKITRILAGNICRQFFFVINTAASTRCLVENFQLICYSQRVNATSQIQRQWQFKVFKMAERSDGWSGETLLGSLYKEEEAAEKDD